MGLGLRRGYLGYLDGNDNPSINKLIARHRIGRSEPPLHRNQLLGASILNSLAASLITVRIGTYGGQRAITAAQYDNQLSLGPIGLMT